MDTANQAFIDAMASKCSESQFDLQSPFFSLAGTLGDLYRRVGSCRFDTTAGLVDLFPSEDVPPHRQLLPRMASRGTTPVTISASSPAFYAYPFADMSAPLALDAQPLVLIAKSKYYVVYWSSGIPLVNGEDVVILDDTSTLVRFASVVHAFRYQRWFLPDDENLVLPSGRRALPPGILLEHEDWRFAISYLFEDGPSSPEGYTAQFSAYTSLVHLLRTDQEREQAFAVLQGERERSDSRGFGLAVQAWIMSHDDPAAAWRKVRRTGEFSASDIYVGFN